MRHIEADHNFMQRCLDLARRGQGKTSPNPMVGAVLVYNNRILSEGWHTHYGGPHAEVHCLQNVSDSDHDLISQSTLYVSLEPCAHYGKTPPCVELILKHQIPAVVIGCLDPNPLVAGKSIAILKENGVEVRFTNLQAQAEQLIEGFAYNVLHKRAFFTCKWAMTQNGIMGSKDAKRLMISGKASQLFTHQLRYQHDAILVGRQTVEKDQPLLDTRYWYDSPKTIIVLDRQLALLNTEWLYNRCLKHHVILVNEREEGQPQAQLQLLKVGADANWVDQLSKKLFQQNIASVLVEGGRQTLELFLESEHTQSINVHQSKIVTVPDGLPAPLIPVSFTIEDQIDLEDDTVYLYKRIKAHGDNAL